MFSAAGKSFIDLSATARFGRSISTTSVAIELDQPLVAGCWSTWNVLCDFLYTAELIPANPMPFVGRPKAAKTLPRSLPQPAVAALRNRKWLHEDALSKHTRGVNAEYLRAISASYAQAMSGHRSRSEDANLHAATAEIEVLSGGDVSRPARDLVNMVIDVHSKIATGTGVSELAVADVDRRRYEVIDLFKADLGLKANQAVLRS